MNLVVNNPYYLVASPIFDRSLNVELRRVKYKVSYPQDESPSFTFDQYRLNAFIALRKALSQAHEASWNGYGAKPADLNAFLYAIQFLECLSTKVPLPEIEVDVDGDFSFEWEKGPRRVFSVRVAGDGTIYYAGLDGYSTFHGTELFQEGIPETISSGINRILSEPGF